MINVRDYAITINGNKIVPTKRRTFLGLVLEYHDTTDNTYALYPMNEYEASHANESMIIDRVTRYALYELCQG